METQRVIREIRGQLDGIMARDAAWCRKRLQSIRRRRDRGQAADRMLKQVLERFHASLEKVRQREQGLPRPDYDSELPIAAHREDIVRTIADHQVVVVAGETGSGKTTQLPKLCLEAGRGRRGLIACTQPRRIAARAMAERVSEELGSALGGIVGYQVRFRDRSSPDGYIKFMTDGILLAETANDRYLDAYDTIIVDEAHERSLNIDFLLGYLKHLIPRRPELKLIITSATIDTDKFSRHFGDAPVIEVSGRGHPIDLIYQPLASEGEKSGRADKDLYQGIAEAVKRLAKLDGPGPSGGDILVFLSGEREIREAGEFLSRQGLKNTEVLPLYARLSSAEQRRVFHPGPKKRVILSTNVAETSLTVPRIRYVIDSGLARISRYAHRSRIQRLPIEAISRASADQRAGRCGRLGPGTCIRLYSEEDFQSRPEYTEPEILRTSLATVILRMLTTGLGAVEEFPFVDPPAPRMISDAYNLLMELGAVDAARKVTGLGRRMARWPMDARLARMVVEGAEHQCLEDVLVLTAALSIQDPRERPLDAQAAADEAHDRFSDPKSDFVSLLNLWAYLRKQRHSISGNRFRKLCRREFLNWQRVLEWFDLYQQLRDQAREERLPLTGRRGDYEQLHKSLLSGLLSQVGRKNPEDHGYQGARSKTFHIFPGSGLFGRTPQWLMSAEIVETTRPFARINAAIQPEWIEAQGRHLLKSHCFDPHWSRRRGAVMAWEQLSLFGLVIVEKRRVRFEAYDPSEARRIFILEALVRGAFDTRAAFMEHNRRIREEIEELEHKRRRRDVLADEHALFEFFDARVPAEVNNAKRLEAWLAGIGEQGRKRLYLGHDVLLREDAGEAPAEQFPDHYVAGGQRLPLEYRFEPGHPADGVTLTVPLEWLNTLDPGALEWLVPGMLRDKLVELIRQLPKPVRRSLTPAVAFADAALDAMRDRRNRPMLESFAAELARMTGIDIGAADLDEAAIPDHLRFRIRVIDKDGGVLADGRSLTDLQERLGSQARRRFMDRQGEGFNRDGETDWTFGRLEECVETGPGVRAWPALVDQGDAVGLRLFDTAAEAAWSHLEGVRRLLAIRLSDKLRYLAKRHGLSRDSLLTWQSLGRSDDLIEDLAWSSLCAAAGDVSGVRSPEAFEELSTRVRSAIVRSYLEQSRWLDDALGAYRRVRSLMGARLASKWPDAAEDIESQLADLVYPGFLGDLEPGRLAHYSRYLKAIEERLHGLRRDPARDRKRLATIEPWWRKYLNLIEAGVPYDEHTNHYRWLLEEYRVSVFAQQLGTQVKVSEKRLQEAWDKVQPGTAV